MSGMTIGKMIQNGKEATRKSRRINRLSAA